MSSQPAPAIPPEPTIETKLKSKYADLLNALNEMQQAMLYAARRPVLREAENLIVDLERQVAALRDDNVKLGTADFDLIKKQQQQIARLVEAGNAMADTNGCNCQLSWLKDRICKKCKESKDWREAVNSITGETAKGGVK